jgi:hypothetical protein
MTEPTSALSYDDSQPRPSKAGLFRPKSLPVAIYASPHCMIKVKIPGGLFAFRQAG